MDVVAATPPLVKSFLAGTLSGTCSTFLFQPLDLVKTRLQSAKRTRIRPGDGLIIVSNVFKKETVTGLWKGMTPSIARCAPGVGVYFGSLHWLSIKFCSGEPRPVEAMCLAAVARTISGISILPFTVIKTRFESDVYKYKSVVHALCKIYSTEGARGLYCGLLPTLIRDVPFSAMYLLFYTNAKNTLAKRNTEMKSSTHFLCGIVSGTMASVLTHPADVIKTQMQLYPHKFTKVNDVVLHIYQISGASGYFIGLMPRILRRTLVTATAWTIYEQVMVTCKLKQ